VQTYNVQFRASYHITPKIHFKFLIPSWSEPTSGITASENFQRILLLCQSVDFTFLSGVQGWNPWLGALPPHPLHPKIYGLAQYDWAGEQQTLEGMKELLPLAYPFEQ
jgi:hypothetical protein